MGVVRVNLYDNACIPIMSQCHLCFSQCYVAYHRVNKYLVGIDDFTSPENCIIMAAFVFSLSHMGLRTSSANRVVVPGSDLCPTFLIWQEHVLAGLIEVQKGRAEWLDYPYKTLVALFFVPAPTRQVSVRGVLHEH